MNSFRLKMLAAFCLLAALLCLPQLHGNLTNTGDNPTITKATDEEPESKAEALPINIGADVLEPAGEQFNAADSDNDSGTLTEEPSAPVPASDTSTANITLAEAQEEYPVTYLSQSTLQAMRAALARAESALETQILLKAYGHDIDYYVITDRVEQVLLEYNSGDWDGTFFATEDGTTYSVQDYWLLVNGVRRCSVHTGQHQLATYSGERIACVQNRECNCFELWMRGYQFSTIAIPEQLHDVIWYTDSSGPEYLIGQHDDYRSGLLELFNMHTGQFQTIQLGSGSTWCQDDSGNLCIEDGDDEYVYNLSGYEPKKMPISEDWHSEHSAIPMPATTVQERIITAVKTAMDNGWTGERPYQLAEGLYAKIGYRGGEICLNDIATGLNVHLPDGLTLNYDVSASNVTWTTANGMFCANDGTLYHFYNGEQETYAIPNGRSYMIGNLTPLDASEGYVELIISWMNMDSDDNYDRMTVHLDCTDGVAWTVADDGEFQYLRSR